MRPQSFDRGKRDKDRRGRNRDRSFNEAAIFRSRKVVKVARKVEKE